MGKTVRGEVWGQNGVKGNQATPQYTLLSEPPSGKPGARLQVAGDTGFPRWGGTGRRAECGQI